MPFAVRVKLPSVLVEEMSLPSIVMLSTAADVLTVSVPSSTVLPVTSKSVPTNNFLAIPTPPSTIKAPDVELVESVTRFRLTASLVLRVVTVAAAAVPDPRIPSNVPVNPVAVIWSVAVIASTNKLAQRTPVVPRSSVLSVSETMSEPLVIPPVATCVAVVVKTPVTKAVVAMFTAPSISTMSRFVVPSTSISPLMSNEAKTEVPVAVTVPLKVVLPELSIVSLVFVPIAVVPILNLSLSPSSTPIVKTCVPDKANARNGSPSVAVLFIIKPVVDPAPPKARLVSAACVSVTSLSAPKPSTAPSDCKVRSSSTNKSGTARSCIRSNTAPFVPPAPSVAIILT